MLRFSVRGVGRRLFILSEKYFIFKEERMAIKKCDYCGKEYDETFFGTLDNGSEACFNCIKNEDDRTKEREREKAKESREI